MAATWMRKIGYLLFFCCSKFLNTKRTLQQTKKVNKFKHIPQVLCWGRDRADSKQTKLSFLFFVVSLNKELQGQVLCFIAKQQQLQELLVTTEGKYIKCRKQWTFKCFLQKGEGGNKSFLVSLVWFCVHWKGGTTDSRSFWNIKKKGKVRNVVAKESVWEEGWCEWISSSGNRQRKREPKCTQMGHWQSSHKKCNCNSHPCQDSVTFSFCITFSFHPKWVYIPCQILWLRSLCHVKMALTIASIPCIFPPYAFVNV